MRRPTGVTSKSGDYWRRLRSESYLRTRFHLISVEKRVLIWEMIAVGCIIMLELR